MKLKIGQKTKCLCHMLKDLEVKSVEKIKKVKHIEIILPIVIGLIMSIFVSVRYINNAMLIKALNDMYYLDLVEAKDRYLLLEVETNPLLRMNKKSKDLELAVLHLKSGEIYNATVDTKNNLFMIYNANKLLENKVFKYNKTVETKLKYEIQKNAQNLNDKYKTQNETNNEHDFQETNSPNASQDKKYVVLELNK